MHSEFDQLLIMHAMCTEELYLVQANVENYLQSTANTINMLERNRAQIRNELVALRLYDHFLTSVTNVMNCARKLNIALEVNSFGQINGGGRQLSIESLEHGTRPSGNNSLKQILPAPLEGFTADLNQNLPNCCPAEEIVTNEETREDFVAPKIKPSQSATLSDDLSKVDLVHELPTGCPAEEILRSIETRMDFVYPKMKLSAKYQIGSTLNVLVTHIENLDKLLFYAVDCNLEHITVICDGAQALDMRQYDSLPPANEVFGLFLDQRILRAVRSYEAVYAPELEENVWPCYLLDLGEIVHTKSSDIKYELTEQQKSLPASAIFCHIEAINSLNIKKENLEQMIYNECSIKVKHVLDDILILDLAVNREKQATEDYGQKINEITNLSHTKMIENGVTILPEPISTNPFLQSPGEDCNTVSNTLTPEELEMFFEDPSHTTNAMKAIFNHVPKDDKRICRFYDPSTGSCFKGRSCKQEHMPLNSKAWTKDVEASASIIDKRLPRTIYPEGKLLNITPTYIGDLEIFYAQINDEPHNKRPLVWHDKEISTFWKQSNRPPQLHELVLCRYNDGLWYRGRVVAHDDEFRNYKVFYVDYGNHQVTGVKNVIKRDHQFGHIPFQAIRCRLAHLTPNDITAEKRKEGVQILSDMLINHPLNVKVISHREDLLVMPIGEFNLTLTSNLVHKGYMKPI